ncbi:cytochrome P450 [Frankia sp. AiPs1]|uniref:cytochrome P450 n=1 Tax=Frankia sp. AiPs1 TaxID=573493 RepID=UPI0020436656|nr:cytochrome P450 [Frankia sp. AiPs1]MCM3923269.1 cytochrome P450 [Frankia sp. AiPs1]
MTTPTTEVTDHRLVGVGAVDEAGDRFDALRARHRVVRVIEPERSYWMVLDHDLVRECLQNPAVFSSEVITPLSPDPPLSMIPIQLDPPEHTQWRRLLAQYFSPRTMGLLRPRLEERTAELVAAIRARGACDYVEDFALELPTVVFLELMGLPIDELPTFLAWEKQALAPTGEGDFDKDRQIGGIFSVVGYFQAEIARRRESGERGDGLLGAMLGWELDGVPAPDDALVNCCLLLFLAGLDTVAMSLSFAMHHLATHDADRRHVAGLAAAGEPIDDVVEELLRFYAVPEVGRKVKQDIEVGGQQLRAGDLVLFPLVAANRDEALVAGADALDLTTGQAAPHLAFGAGPHRCLGSHLARIEMTVALAGWHRVIPEYALRPDTTPRAYWGNVHGIFALPLAEFGS